MRLTEHRVMFLYFLVCHIKCVTDISNIWQHLLTVTRSTSILAERFVSSHCEVIRVLSTPL